MKTYLPSFKLNNSFTHWYQARRMVIAFFIKEHYLPGVKIIEILDCDKLLFRKLWQLYLVQQHSRIVMTDRKCQCFGAAIIWQVLILMNPSPFCILGKKNDDNFVHKITFILWVQKSLKNIAIISFEESMHLLSNRQVMQVICCYLMTLKIQESLH